MRVFTMEMTSASGLQSAFSCRNIFSGEVYGQTPKRNIKESPLAEE